MSGIVKKVFSSLMPKWVNKREEFNDWFCGAAEPGLKGDDPRCEEMISVGIKRCGSMLEPQSNWGTRIWNIILRKLYTPQEERATRVALKNHFEGSFAEQCKKFLELANQQRVAHQQENMTTLVKWTFAIAVCFLLACLFFYVVCPFIKRQSKYDLNLMINDHDIVQEKNKDEGDGDGDGDGDGEVKVKKTF